MDAILSVRELTDRLRQVVEQRFPFVWVRGEVTNLSRPASGHVYFSLKEGDCLLGCVWFRGQQQEEAFDPMTGEFWEGGPRPSLAQVLENGQSVVCAGRLSVYGGRGLYQLVVEMAQSTGQGDWYREFERLKQKLAALGYFSAERKRPLPARPQRVAVVTAPKGAAVQDFLRISAQRGLPAELRIYPTLVQGDDAPPALVAALGEAQNWADVVVLVRGGGSLQDLWAFNDERVATAIFQSTVPVLTGVGHETDRSIADFVADMSAATPSHAAQLLWPERLAFVQQVDEDEMRLRRALAQCLNRNQERLDRTERVLQALSPLLRLRNQGQVLEQLGQRLRQAGQKKLEGQEQRLVSFGERLSRAGQSLLNTKERAWEALNTQVQSLNPKAPLERGYALIWRQERAENGAYANKLLCSVHESAPGAELRVEVSDGYLNTVVRSLHEHAPVSKSDFDTENIPKNILISKENK